MIKKSEYGDIVWEVELASFPPLVFLPLEAWVKKQLYSIVVLDGHIAPLCLGLDLCSVAYFLLNCLVM